MQTISVLDFLYHHLEGKSDKQVLDEAEKCVPLCKICHTELHAGLLDINEILEKGEVWRSQVERASLEN